MAIDRVLVVDDDPAILALCHKILEGDGYKVVDAKRGEDALERLENESFDLLLTDIRLPGLSGLEVIQRLRDRDTELTVVTMTGYSNMEMAIQALSLGVDEFIVKPFTLDSLRLLVSRALEKSRLRRENMRLRALEQLKTEFLTIAAHELRTPLAVLRGYATLLRDKSQGVPREYAEQVLQCADRLQKLSDDMLELKFLEGDQADLRLEMCPVEQVVSEVVDSYRSLARERELSIELAVDAASGQVEADRGMLDAMLGSLLSNAIKFSPPKTNLRVAATGDDRQVTLVVQDQGKGLTPDQANHVFDPYYQADQSLSREAGGMGLGLTLTSRMVNAHGGKIWVESEFNHGSSFFIALPREHPSSRVE